MLGSGQREREMLSVEIDAAGCGNTIDAAECRNRCCWVYVETEAAGCM